MSKIGRLPVEFVAPVEVVVEEAKVVVRGPKGELVCKIPERVSVAVREGRVMVRRKGDTPREKALQGWMRSEVKNMIWGVREGWGKRLELVGTGYRAGREGENLVLTVGYSHPVVVEAEEGVEFEVKEGTKLVVRGIDRAKVGEVAARIRAVRPPEPYKGKGIRYEGEVVRRKPGKVAAKAVTA